MGELNLRQKKFIQFYEGNATKAAIKAGYSPKTARVLGCQLLTKLNKYIKNRQDKKTSSGIATREDRQKFWTEMMLNKKTGTLSRLRASELLGKSEADFIDKVEHSGAIEAGITIISSKHTVKL